MDDDGELDPANPWMGRVLDERYRVTEVLGAGGLGLVLRATHLGIDRQVAVKVLQHRLLAQPGLRKRFDREVKVLSRLAHPHIVSIIDSGTVDDDATYLVMELLSGQTLEELLDERGLLLPSEATAVTRQILLGLAEAHDQGVLHRDIKPANVFLSPMADGAHVKLLDFGLAKPDPALGEAGASSLTGEGIVVGTPTYMSPEMAALDEITAASDLYAVGVVLFEMLTGVPPFDGESKLEILKGHLEAPVPELDEVSPGFDPPEALRQIVRIALAKEPGSRFASAREMLAALEEVGASAAETPRAIVPRNSKANATLEIGASELEELTEESDEARENDDAEDSSEPQLEVVERVASSSPPPPPIASRASPLRVVAVLLALAGIGVAGWWGYKESRPAVAPAPIVAEEGVQPLEDELAQERLQSAPNPFAARPIPTELREARRAVVRGRVLDRAQVRAVTRYQRTHARDPRPALLLARHHRLRGRYAPMVRSYRDAHAASETAVGFEPMLADLARAARDADAHDEAVGLLRDAYGRRALPELEVQLADPLADADRQRLERAQAALRTD